MTARVSKPRSVRCAIAASTLIFLSMTSGVALSSELASVPVGNVPRPHQGGEAPSHGLRLPVADKYASGVPFRECPVCPEMVAVPTGKFVMGAAPDEEERMGVPAGIRGRSAPQRVVEIRRQFAIGRFEVTLAEFTAFANATGHNPVGGCWVRNKGQWGADGQSNWRTPGFPQNSRHPVACVNWEDAKAYVQWLSQQTGKPYRLLTEAEWEYAARAGTTASRFWGEDAIQGCTFANFASGAETGCDDRHEFTSPVGSQKPNAFGVYDMLGNVWEWVEDCWNENYQGAPTDAGAWTNKGDCSRRGLRGGSWLDALRLVRAAFRNRDVVGVRNYVFGFRVARTLD
jgi:formylglycine-generating enzyme required for sulfatase activity